MNIFFKFFFGLIVLAVSPWIYTLINPYGPCHEGPACAGFSALLFPFIIIAGIAGLYYKNPSDKK